MNGARTEPTRFVSLLPETWPERYTISGSMHLKLENTMIDRLVKARWQRLSCNRALVLDLLALAARHAYFPVEQTFDLGEVAGLRAAAARRISWSVLFMKAYATVAAKSPQLRQAYCRWPWPRLCESVENVAMIAINREYRGEERICWGRFTSPEQQSLAALQEALDAYQAEPVERIFRRQVRLSKCPTALRRLIWWLNLNFAKRRRAKRLGTFSMSTLAGQQTLNRFHPTLLTSSLSFGPPDERGQAAVTLICDHRVLDGAAAARALSALQNVLCGSIAEELRAMHAARAAA
jgi:hypothetical protein